MVLWVEPMNLAKKLGLSIISVVVAVEPAE
jgi:hypothetical protein